MAELSGSAPIRGLAWPAAKPSEQATQEGATARAARLYNRELGELNRLQRVAQQRGEVVTEAGIQLEFETRGPKLIAKDASSSFTSREPTPTPIERAEMSAAPAPEPDAPAPAEAASPAAVVAVRDEVAERITRLNQRLTRGSPPAAAPERVPSDPALDATV